ncbi:PEGA domain-containing protein [Candidatus Woesearchaeota archaeon]|nr:PEGA domain-containing protein [Candidatus Woesearchaeota archaeon]
MKAISLCFVVLLLFIAACQPKYDIKGLEQEILNGANNANDEVAEEGTGFIAVESSEENADVYMDDLYQGKIPLTLNNIAAGQHRIAVKKEGFADFETSVAVEAGKKSSVQAELAEIPKEEITEELKEPEEAAEQPKESVQDSDIPEAGGVFELGNEYLHYFDLSHGTFSTIRSIDSEAFSKRSPDTFQFTAINPVKIRAVVMNIDDVNEEDCGAVNGAVGNIESGQSLCIKTRDGKTGALGWQGISTENARMRWKLFN